MRSGFIQEMRRNYPLYLMFLPGIALLLIFNYIPMAGIIIAFKSFVYRGGFIDSLLASDWVGFKNFEFFLQTPDAWRITRNTILYNVAFIVLGLILSVALAIGIHEVMQRRLAKLYQSVLFLPYFLSWVVVSYLVYALLSPQYGIVNKVILEPLGYEAINFYLESAYWPYILILLNIWKYSGYSMIVYLAAITGIDNSYYEAASIDGATRWQQIRLITVPLLYPMMIILTILAVGRIFYGDFGLFFNVTLNTGIIRETTDVIDTYVYNGLMTTGDIGMAAAAGLYQSVIGFVLVLSTNLVVRRINRDYALF